MPKAIAAGTRVRMKVRTFVGWKGTGTVTEVYGDSVRLVKDGYPLADSWGGMVDAMRHEVSVLKDQSHPHAGSKLELVMREWPDLTYHGFFSPKDGETSVAQFSRKRCERAEMLSEEALKQFDLAADYIWDHLGLEDGSGQLAFSYYLKHALEECYKEKGDRPYVSNGMFICAMIAAGFRPRKICGLFCKFLISHHCMRSVDRCRERARAPKLPAGHLEYTPPARRIFAPSSCDSSEPGDLF
jgi:hypothetical protein